MYAAEEASYYLLVEAAAFEGGVAPRINEGGRIAISSKISDIRNYVERRLLSRRYARRNGQVFLQILYTDAI